MRRVLEGIRKRFWEYDANAHDAGFATLTAPIFDHSERIQAALSIVWSGRSDDSVQDLRYIKQVRETALEISRTLGSTEMANEMAATMH